METVLNILRESIGFWRELAILLVIISCVKFGARLIFDYQIQKLKSPSTYELEMSNQHRVLRITTHNKIHMERIQSIANGETRILIDNTDKVVKDEAA